MVPPITKLCWGISWTMLNEILILKGYEISLFLVPNTFLL